MYQVHKEIHIYKENKMAKEKINFEDEQVRENYRHTTSHIMAQAVKKLWPDAKLAIGPAIENGFYYDFDMEHVLEPNDLLKIQKEMKKIIQANYPLERFELPREEAIKFMADKDEDYKVELIQDLPEDAVISFYKQGDFTDLCAGPHMESTGQIKAVKLQSIAGAYWRGDSNRKMLQRIYGTCFPSQAELDEYLTKLEEAKKRDHRKLGRVRDSRSSCLREWLSETSLKTSGRRSTTTEATRKSEPLLFSTSSSGEPQVTGITTRTTCTSLRSMRRIMP